MKITPRYSGVIFFKATRFVGKNFKIYLCDLMGQKNVGFLPSSTFWWDKNIKLKNKKSEIFLASGC